jgi:uncharacterized repeat protein (TIGR03803 family)
MKTSMIKLFVKVPQLFWSRSCTAKAYRFLTAAGMALAYNAVCSAQTFTTIGTLDNGTGDNPGYFDTLTLSPDGSTLYGTTYSDGNSGYGNGTVFKVSTSGTTITVVHDFYGNDGSAPIASLALSGAKLYGVTQIGGTNGDGWGTIFTVETNGTSFTKMYDFGTISDDGQWPHGGLVLSSNVLYGTTSGGGAHGYGTVFKMNTDGSNYTVYSLASGDSAPNGTLVIDTSGNLYGVANGGGTVFTLTVNFTGRTDLCTGLYWPVGPLLLHGLYLYGSMPSGGSSGYGAIFEVPTTEAAQQRFTLLPAATTELIRMAGWQPKANASYAARAPVVAPTASEICFR